MNLRLLHTLQGTPEQGSPTSSRAGIDFIKKYNDLLLNWYYFLEIWPGKIHSEANKILVHSTKNQYGLRNLGQTLGRTEARFASFLCGAGLPCSSTPGLKVNQKQIS